MLQVSVQQLPKSSDSQKLASQVGLPTSAISEASRFSYALTARERSFDADTRSDSYSSAGLCAVVNEEYD